MIEEYTAGYAPCKALVAVLATSGIRSKIK